MKDYLAKFSSTHLDGKEQKRRELSILMANLHVRSILMSALLLGVLFSGMMKVDISTFEPNGDYFEDSTITSSSMERYGLTNSTAFVHEYDIDHFNNNVQISRVLFEARPLFPSWAKRPLKDHSWAACWRGSDLQRVDRGHTLRGVRR